MEKIAKRLGSISSNIPKNILQFLIGVALYYVLISDKIPLTTILGLFSFLLAYSAVYLFNDIMDYEHDIRDSLKRKTKAIARGDLSKLEAVNFLLVFVVVGLLLSAFVNKYFTILLSFILFLNFLFSSEYTRFKDKWTRAPTIFLIQLLKFSAGWFAVTANLANFPFLFMLSLSFFYTGGYFCYKNLEFEVEDVFHSPSSLLPFIAGGIMYLLSIWIYPFKFPLLIILLAFIALITTVMILKSKGIKIRSQSSRWFSEKIFIIISLAFVTVLLLSLSIPSVAKVNRQISEPVKPVRCEISGEPDDGVETVYCYLNGSFFRKYNVSNLEQVEFLITNDTEKLGG